MAAKSAIILLNWGVNIRGTKIQANQMLVFILSCWVAKDTGVSQKTGHP